MSVPDDHSSYAKKRKQNKRDTKRTSKIKQENERERERKRKRKRQRERERRGKSIWGGAWGDEKRKNRKFGGKQYLK